MIYLLDTDHLSILQRGGVNTTRLINRLATIGSNDYATTIVSYEEQCRGWADRINRAQTPAARVVAYTELQRSLDFYRDIAVADYDERADAQYVVLKGTLKSSVGTKDLRIAAITMSRGATLLTHNTKHFVKIPGLLFDDWTL